VTNPIVPALIAFLAAILGGFIQAAFTASRERRAFRWTLNKESYVLFLQAAAGMAKNPEDSPDRTKYVQMSIEAIGRILLQGSPAVVQALKIHQSNGTLDSNRKFEDFGRLVEAMRADVGGTPINNFASEVREILFESKL
jgi:hypothetical protein